MKTSEHRSKRHSIFSWGLFLTAYTITYIFLAALGFNQPFSDHMSPSEDVIFHWGFMIIILLAAFLVKPDRFAAQAQIHWMIWGGLTCILLHFLWGRVYQPAEGIRVVLRWGIIAASFVIAHWLAFRDYTLPPRQKHRQTSEVELDGDQV